LAAVAAVAVLVEAVVQADLSMNNKFNYLQILIQ
jgi:hypothetical protein